MQLFRYILASFSMFSAVPVKKELNAKDFKYIMTFLPFVGLSMGFLSFLLASLLKSLNINNLAISLLLTLFPVLFTGGIHMDGFMDCHDAFASHCEKEKMLLIMKDSRSGAFAVIYAVMYFLSYFIFILLMPKNINTLIFIPVVYSFSRCCGALAVLYMNNAKETGMARDIKESQEEKLSKKVLIFESLLITAAGFYIDFKTEAVLLIFSFLCSSYCIRKMKNLFQGITGDLAGWFICCNELSMIFSLTLSKGGLYL